MQQQHTLEYVQSVLCVCVFICALMKCGSEEQENAKQGRRDPVRIPSDGATGTLYVELYAMYTHCHTTHKFTAVPLDLGCLRVVATKRFGGKRRRVLKLLKYVLCVERRFCCHTNNDSIGP